MIRLLRRTAAGATLVFAAPAAAQSANCNQPARDAITHVAVDGSPFTPVVSPDGCWIYVTVTNVGQNAVPRIAVMRRDGGKVSVVRSIPIKGNPTGAALTHDAKMLVVAAGPSIAFLDVARMQSGQGNAVLGYIDTGKQAGFIYASVTPDDQFAFVAIERGAAIAVVDLAKIRAGKIDTNSIVGLIPTGNAPVAVEFSADGKYIYSTAQAALPAWGWPVACRPEGQPNAAMNHANGAIVVAEVAKAITDPEHSVVARVAAGCNPVRLVTSPSGDRVYVTARGDNVLLVFDAAKLLSDTAHARIATVPVGKAPVGVTVIDGGKRIVVTNSNRFGGAGANDKQSLNVIDATKVESGAAAVVGSIPAGAFPRELRVTADGKTLLATNFNSKTLEIVDLARLTLGPVQR